MLSSRAGRFLMPYRIVAHTHVDLKVEDLFTREAVLRVQFVTKSGAEENARATYCGGKNGVYEIVKVD